MLQVFTILSSTGLHLLTHSEGIHVLHKHSLYLCTYSIDLPLPSPLKLWLPCRYKLPTNHPPLYRVNHSPFSGKVTTRLSVLPRTLYYSEPSIRLGPVRSGTSVTDTEVEFSVPSVTTCNSTSTLTRPVNTQTLLQSKSRKLSWNKRVCLREVRQCVHHEPKTLIPRSENVSKTVKSDKETME